MLEVVAAPDGVARPPGHATIAERFADVVEVGALAAIDVIVVVTRRVPLLDDETARALVPDVDAIARHRIRCFLQSLAVDAERDAVALPGHVVARIIVAHRDSRLVGPP